MNILKIWFLAALLTCTIQAGESMSEALQKKATVLINTFILNMQNNSFEKSAKEVVPLMHKSLLDSNKKSLDSDTYSFSFKKAQRNAKNYAYPVKITRIQKLKTTEIGYGATHEKGVEYKLWIDKKPSVQGMPAPLVLFFQDGTEDPKLSYVGSL